MTLYCYNNTEAEIHQEYQQPTQLRELPYCYNLHTIHRYIPAGRDTPGVPAAVAHSYENYRTVTITHVLLHSYDTVHNYTRYGTEIHQEYQQSHTVTQLRELPYCYNYTRYRTEIHQEYQQSNTVTRITVLLQLHTIRDRDTPGVPAVAHSYENYRTVTITHDTGTPRDTPGVPAVAHSYRTVTITHDTGPRYTRSTSSRYNYTRYRTEIHQEYQQSNTVTRTTVLLQLHTIRDRDTPGVPAVAHSYENYRTVTITHDTGLRYTRSTSSRTQLPRYKTEIHQEYQQSLHLHTIRD